MRKRSKSARYLLRFDDLCPTMNWKVWSEIETTLTELRFKPVLAVVPDNRDPVLRVDDPKQDFWERVRQWQARGWTIALHGFQHKYTAEHAGIVTPNRYAQEKDGIRRFHGLETGGETTARRGNLRAARSQTPGLDRAQRFI